MMTQPLIMFQDVLRDGIQSLFGTNPSADEILNAYPTAHLIGCSSIQTGGGTFFDIFAKKGRNEWQEIEKLISHFKQHGITQSALIRGDFLFGYEPQPYDVIEAMILEYAKMGMNILQNFHGMNDPHCLLGVAKAVKVAQAQGYDIKAQGTICIEDNMNITIDNCLLFAHELIAIGHEGFYLKSASGAIDPDFVGELTAKLLETLPEQPITVHVHGTYGRAALCYMMAIEQAVKREKPICVDVQHPSLAGSTAHPSMLKMLELIKNHPSEQVRDAQPQLNIDAIRQSKKSLFALRFLYRDFESQYNAPLLAAMQKARAPGGATSTLKSIPGLVENLQRLLGKDGKQADWNAIQIAIYNMQEEILEDLGDLTQVTPYAANTTGQAAISLYNELSDKDRFATLYPGIINFLCGHHGKLPESVNRILQAQALQQEGMKRTAPYIPASERTPALPEMKEALKQAGIRKPTIRQMISATLLKDGVAHVVACAKKQNQPQTPPTLPHYAQTPTPINKRHISEDGKHLLDIRDAVAAIGSYEKLQEVAERVVHLKQIDDGLHLFPQGSEFLQQHWRDNNIKKLSQLLQNINQNLEEAGYSKIQILSTRSSAGLNNIDGCIRDVVEHKGEGLYDFMCKSVSDYQNQKNTN